MARLRAEANTGSARIAADQVDQVERAAKGVEHAGIRAAARLAGVSIPLRALSRGAGFIGGLVGAEVILQGFGDAIKASEKLQKELGDLRREGGLSVEATARLGAQATATGTDIGALAEAIKSLRGTGETFDQARARLEGIADVSERAAAAQRTFGDSASKIAPLLAQEASAAGIAADKLARLRELTLRSEIARVTAGIGPDEGVLGIGGTIKDQQESVRLQQQIADERRKAVGSFLGLPVGHGLLGAFTKEDLEAMDAAERRWYANKAAAIQYDRAAIKAGDDTADLAKRLGDLRVGLSPEAAKALDIAVKMHLDEASIASVLRAFGADLENVSADAISRAVKSGLDVQLSGAFRAGVLDPLTSATEDREATLERIKDLEENIADRHRSSARESFDFSKAELQERLRARDAEHAFFSFRERITKGTDTSRLDARDLREKAKLEDHLAKLDKDHPFLSREKAVAEYAAKNLRQWLGLDDWHTQMDDAGRPINRLVNSANGAKLTIDFISSDGSFREEGEVQDPEDILAVVTEAIHGGTLRVRHRRAATPAAAFTGFGGSGAGGRRL
jgi:hypothetical protein